MVIGVLKACTGILVLCKYVNVNSTQLLIYSLQFELNYVLNVTKPGSLENTLISWGTSV